MKRFYYYNIVINYSFYGSKFCYCGVKKQRDGKQLLHIPRYSFLSEDLDIFINN